MNSDKIILPILPESGIINGNPGDSGIPEKRRLQGDKQPNYIVRFSNSEDQTVYFAFPVPPQASVGDIAADISVFLNIAHNSALSGNAKFDIAWGFVKNGELYDKALGAFTSVGTKALVAADQYKSKEIQGGASGVFSGLVDTESAKLIIAIKRDVSVASNIATDIDLLVSSVMVSFTSVLESRGVPMLSLEHTGTVQLKRDDINKIIFGNSAGGALTIKLPDDCTEADDGRRISVTRDGINGVSVDVNGGAGYSMRGATAPLALAADEDYAEFMFIWGILAWQLVGTN